MKRASMTPRRTALAALVGSAALLAVPLSALGVAEFVVYHSEAGDGSGSRGAKVLNGTGPHTLHLYMAEQEGAPAVASNPPGAACESGVADGTERCGWDVVIEGVPAPGVSFSGFNPAAGVVGGIVASGTGAHRLRANGGDHVNGDLGPTWIGDVVVQGTGEVWLRAQTTAVKANLQLRSLDEGVIVYVPEPAVSLGLLAGTLCLGALRSRRRC